MLKLDKNPRVIQLLKALLLYLSDSQKAYKECARVIRIEGLKTVLIDEANQRITMLRKIQTQLDRLSQQFSLLHGFVLNYPVRRLYLNVRGLTSSNKTRILKEVKHGDNKLVRVYADVLREKLPPILHRTLLVQLKHFNDTLCDLEKLSQ